MDELALHVLDIAQNAITAGAKTVTIRALQSLEADSLDLWVEDDGCGMSPAMLESVTSPFTTSRTTRKVGLGIPLLKQTAEMTGGSFVIESTEGVGTKLHARYVPSSLDMLPLGDMGSTMLLLVQQKPDMRFVYERSLGDRSFTLDTDALRTELEGVPLDTPEVLDFIQGFVQENESELQA